MGDDEDGAPSTDAAHVLLDDPFAFVVENERAVVGYFCKDEEPPISPTGDGRERGLLQTFPIAGETSRLDSTGFGMAQHVGHADGLSGGDAVPDLLGVGGDAVKVEEHYERGQASVICVFLPEHIGHHAFQCFFMPCRQRALAEPLRRSISLPRFRLTAGVSQVSPQRRISYVTLSIGEPVFQSGFRQRLLELPPFVAQLPDLVRRGGAPSIAYQSLSRPAFERSALAHPERGRSRCQPWWLCAAKTWCKLAFSE
jgi:hypothetical protein